MAKEKEKIVASSYATKVTVKPEFDGYTAIVYTRGDNNQWYVLKTSDTYAKRASAYACARRFRERYFKIKR